MRKYWLVTLVALGAISLATAVRSTQARDNKEDGGLKVAQEVTDSLMQQKLKHAQDLLSALSIGDYERMVTHSRELQRISLEARWSQPHSPAYAGYGDDFRNALERIAIAAEKQNIDGAVLNYVQVVLTCVQCHKVVREGQELAHAADLGDFGLLDFAAPATGD